MVTSGENPEVRGFPATVGRDRDRGRLGNGAKDRERGRQSEKAEDNQRYSVQAENWKARERRGWSDVDDDGNDGDARSSRREDRSANGTRFDVTPVTAAHRKLLNCGSRTDPVHLLSETQIALSAKSGGSFGGRTLSGNSAILLGTGSVFVEEQISSKLRRLD